MATAKRITDLMLERQRPPASGRLTLWDTAEAGVGVRIGAKRKTFILKLRHRGRQQMLTLGQYPAMAIADARAAARKIKSLSAHGIDPTGHRTPQSAGGNARLTTVSQVVEAYIERYARPNQRSWKDTAGHLHNSLVRLFGPKPVAAIVKADILHMLDDVRARGVVQGANRLLAHSKRFFGWCVEQGVIENSPASDVRAPFKERVRDRVLSDAEIRRIWTAAEAIGFPIGPAVQMLLLAGQRRDEVSHMRWDDLNFAAAIWTIPAERNKSARPHNVPLSKLGLDVLGKIPNSDGFVFWGRSPSTAINGWSQAKQRIDSASGVNDWRIHDLRRTAATGMARLGFDPHIVEKVLNHATSSAGPLARVYQRYAYEKEKREALEAWGQALNKLGHS